MPGQTAIPTQQVNLGNYHAGQLQNKHLQNKQLVTTSQTLELAGRLGSQIGV